MAFSILFCAVLSNHVYAYSILGSPQTGSVGFTGDAVYSYDGGSVYFEQVLTSRVRLTVVPLIGKYYVFSGGLKDLKDESVTYLPYYSSVNYDFFVEIGGKRFYTQYDTLVFEGQEDSYVTFGVIVRGTVSSKPGSAEFNNFLAILSANYKFSIYELSDQEVSNFHGYTGIISGLDENNELQKEQNETSKGILGKITEFFASFFENLKGLFVPEDGYFSDFFTRLNDFFSEKLGMLYAPIDMFITFLNTIKDASSTDSGITFPELAWDGTVIIPETKFSFDTIYKDFPDLKEKIYFVTDVILVGAVLWLLQVKLKEVLEN